MQFTSQCGVEEHNIKMLVICRLVVLYMHRGLTNFGQRHGIYCQQETVLEQTLAALHTQEVSVQRYGDRWKR